MMTLEEIKSIESYCSENGVTIKQRLHELNIPESNFYYARLRLPSCEQGTISQALEWRDLAGMIRHVINVPNYRLRCLRSGVRIY